MARDGSGTYSLPEAAFQSGQVISSTAMNSDLSDIAAALTASIAKDGQTTPTANLPMGTFRHTGVGNSSARTMYGATGQIQDGAFDWCGTAGGTADALTLTPSPAITAYAAGGKFRFIAGGSPNTGATTVAVSGLAAKAIQNNGSALTAGDIAAGKMYEITYDGTQFQLAQVSLAAIAAASETVAGKIEIATAAETTTGTDDARAITPLKLTTFAPASATIDTANDKLIAIDATDSKLKQMAFPSVSGNFVKYRITDSTDVSISTTCAAGGVNVGSGQSITLAAGDQLLVAINTGRVEATISAGWAIGVGINVNSTNYFVQGTIAGTARYAPMAAETATSPTLFAGMFYGANSRIHPFVVFDVSALGISTGAQTVQVKLGKTADAAATDTPTLKGTVVTSIIDLWHLKA